MAARRQQIRVVVTALGQFVDQVIKALVLAVVANLVQAPSEGGTPVDTGWARANWVPRIGAPFTATAGTRKQAEEGNVSSAAQQSGIAQVATGYTTARGVVHITNNVPYIVPLNEGHSQQAAPHFVEAAIWKAVHIDLLAAFLPGAGRR